MGFAEWRGEDQLPKVITGDFGSFDVTDQDADVAQLLAPIDPRAILGIGLNYRAHAEETGKPLPKYPLLFMKAVNAVQNPNQPILLPRTLVSHYVLGYTVANDVSARDWQFEWGEGQFCRGKTFDTFCPLGPCMVTTDEIENPNDLSMRTRVNGELRQETNTGDMIFDIPTLISFLSGSTTLVPGTVILTGTPSGVGAAQKPPAFLKEGDRVDISIDGIGTLSNPVKEEKK